MFSDEKAVEILDRLLEKTRARKVNWHAGTPDEEPTMFDEIDSFFLQLPESRVTITFESPKVEVDRFVVEFENKDGVKVKRLVIDEEDPRWELVLNLYQEAGRVTVAWDRVLDDLENAVQSQGQIGLPVKEIGL